MDCNRHARPSPRQPAAADVEWLLIPPGIQLFETRSGRVLGPKVQMAWAWLFERSGGRLPAVFSFRLIDLALALQGSASSTAHRLLARLADEDLATVLSRQRGRGGSITIRLNDPATVTGLRCQHGEPQRDLQFDETAHIVPFADVPYEGPSGASAPNEQTTASPDQESSTFERSPSAGRDKSSQSESVTPEPFAELPDHVRLALHENSTIKSLTTLS